MNVFGLRNGLIEDYASFVSSYIRIRDYQIEQHVKQELELGALWPDPLVQLNPSFVKGESVDELVEENKSEIAGYTHDLPDWVHVYAKIRSPSPMLGEGRGEEAGFPLPPFKWEEDRRAILRAELDAYYAKLYGLTEEELRYILDPTDVYGEDFPSETFRVLKEKETRLYNEYRTKRLILEAWVQLEYISTTCSLPAPDLPLLSTTLPRRWINELRDLL